MSNLILKSTREAMIAHAQTLPAGSSRAQCYTIAGYYLENGQTIASRLLNDHCSSSYAMAAAKIMVAAGCATETKGQPSCYGSFTFQDNSTLN